MRLCLSKILILLTSLGVSSAFADGDLLFQTEAAFPCANGQCSSQAKGPLDSLMRIYEFEDQVYASIKGSLKVPCGTKTTQWTNESLTSQILKKKAGSVLACGIGASNFVFDTVTLFRLRPHHVFKGGGNPLVGRAKEIGQEAGLAMRGYFSQDSHVRKKQFDTFVESVVEYSTTTFPNCSKEYQISKICELVALVASSAIPVGSISKASHVAKLAKNPHVSQTRIARGAGSAAAGVRAKAVTSAINNTNVKVITNTGASTNLVKGQSYTAIVVDGELILGANIASPLGVAGGRASHESLRLIVARQRYLNTPAGRSVTDPRYILPETLDRMVRPSSVSARGTVVVGDDGVVYVSGYGAGFVSPSNAQSIQNALGLGDDVQFVTTGDKLSTIYQAN